MKKYSFVVSMGDPNGIGPEIILKYHKKYPQINFLLSGSKKIMDWWSDFYKISYSFDIDDCGFDYLPEPGKETKEAGEISKVAIKNAYVSAKEFSIPIVTLPISKRAICFSSPGFTGHTEYLAELDGLNKTDDIVMLLGGDRMKVVTLTRHIPLLKVSEVLTEDYIIKQVKIVASWYKKWKKRDPEIWLSGLNPHAGEDGELGSEEHDTIIPAVTKLQQEGINIKGPFPSDTMFHFGLKENIDLLFSCYHDQGLGPLKLIHFDDGVNVTIGLSIVRTSVDHGTAFNIAGKDLASIESFETAVKWASEMGGSDE